MGHPAVGVARGPVGRAEYAVADSRGPGADADLLAVEQLVAGAARAQPTGCTRFSACSRDLRVPVSGLRHSGSRPRRRAIVAGASEIGLAIAGLFGLLGWTHARRAGLVAPGLHEAERQRSPSPCRRKRSRPFSRFRWPGLADHRSAGWFTLPAGIGYLLKTRRAPPSTRLSSRSTAAAYGSARFLPLFTAMAIFAVGRSRTDQTDNATPEMADVIHRAGSICHDGRWAARASRVRAPVVTHDTRRTLRERDRQVHIAPSRLVTGTRSIHAVSQIPQDLVDGVHADQSEAGILHVHDHLNGRGDDGGEAQNVYPATTLATAGHAMACEQRAYERQRAEHGFAPPWSWIGETTEAVR